VSGPAAGAHRKRILVHYVKMAKRSVCPVACALDLIGDRWTLLVVRDMACGKVLFNEFSASPERIAFRCFLNAKPSLAFALLGTSGCCGLPVREPGADPEDPHAPRRTTRTAAGITCPRPAHRLGRTRRGPLSTATSFRRRPKNCPRSTSTASEPCRGPGHDKAAGLPDSERLRVDTRKTPFQGERGLTQGATFQAGTASGGGSNPLTSRSSVGRCLRKCHWPRCPSRRPARGFSASTREIRARGVGLLQRRAASSRDAMSTSIVALATACCSKPDMPSARSTRTPVDRCRSGRMNDRLTTSSTPGNRGSNGVSRRSRTSPTACSTSRLVESAERRHEPVAFRPRFRPGMRIVRGPLAVPLPSGADRVEQIIHDCHPLVGGKPAAPVGVGGPRPVAPGLLEEIPAMPGRV